MTFLANENFPFPSIKYLRDQGITVHSITEQYPGVSDDEVIMLATKENHIILTFDKDYGEIIFKLGLPKPPGVIFFRYKGVDVLFPGKYMVSLIAEHKTIEDSFIVVEEHNFRLRPDK